MTILVSKKNVYDRPDSCDHNVMTLQVSEKNEYDRTDSRDGL